MNKKIKLSSINLVTENRGAESVIQFVLRMQGKLNELKNYDKLNTK